MSSSPPRRLVLVPAGRSDAAVRRYRLARLALEERDVRCPPRPEQARRAAVRGGTTAVTAW